MLNPVQNCLNFQLHGWSLGSCCSVAAEQHWITRRPVFFSPHRAILRDGSENRALQECNPSAEPSMDCKDCIRPGSGKLPGRVLALRMPLQAMVKAENSPFPLGPQAAILNFLPTNSATDPSFHRGTSLNINLENRGLGATFGGGVEGLYSPATRNSAVFLV